MCFSAGASFTAAAVLGTVGLFSLRKTTERSQKMFASIPLLFGIQQLSEGLLWLALGNSGYEGWEGSATYFFLFFAQFLWPFYIPVSMLLLEKNKQRKKALYFISASGVVTSLILIYRLIFYSVKAEILGHHIHYDIESPQILIILSSIFYTIGIIFPGYASSVKGMKVLAVCLTLTLITTKIFFDVYLISVWCFFAANLSIIIIWILSKIRQEQALSSGDLHHRMSTH